MEISRFRVANRDFGKGNNTSHSFFYLCICIVSLDRRSKGGSSNRNDKQQGEDKTEVVHVQPRKQ